MINYAQSVLSYLSPFPNIDFDAYEPTPKPPEEPEAPKPAASTKKNEPSTQRKLYDTEKDAIATLFRMKKWVPSTNKALYEKLEKFEKLDLNMELEAETILADIAECEKLINESQDLQKRQYIPIEKSSGQYQWSICRKAHNLYERAKCFFTDPEKLSLKYYEYLSEKDLHVSFMSSWDLSQTQSIITSPSRIKAAFSILDTDQKNHLSKIAQKSKKDLEKGLETNPGTTFTLEQVKERAVTEWFVSLTESERKELAYCCDRIKL